MDRLNAGLLPPGYFAMAEQIIGQPFAMAVSERDLVQFNLRNRHRLLAAMTTFLRQIAESLVKERGAT